VTVTLNIADPVVVRTAGVLAVVGGLINAVSDYYLQGGPALREAVNTYEYLPYAPYDLVAVGSNLGNAALPLWLCGFLPLYPAIAPAGRWLTIPPIQFSGWGWVGPRLGGIDRVALAVVVPT
jgi:hypothetical protein